LINVLGHTNQWSSYNGYYFSDYYFDSLLPHLEDRMSILQAQKSQLAATIFVDHHSAVPYAHLQKSTNAKINKSRNQQMKKRRWKEQWLLNTKLQRVV
jgi:hypothetical protein